MGDIRARQSVGARWTWIKGILIHERARLSNPNGFVSEKTKPPVRNRVLLLLLLLLLLFLIISGPVYLKAKWWRRDWDRCRPFWAATSPTAWSPSPNAVLPWAKGAKLAILMGRRSALVANSGPFQSVDGHASGICSVTKLSFVGLDRLSGRHWMTTSWQPTFPGVGPPRWGYDCQAASCSPDALLSMSPSWFPSCCTPVTEPKPGHRLSVGCGAHPRLDPLVDGRHALAVPGKHARADEPSNRRAVREWKRRLCQIDPPSLTWIPLSRLLWHLYWTSLRRPSFRDHWPASPRGSAGLIGAYHFHKDVSSLHLPWTDRRLAINSVGALRLPCWWFLSSPPPPETRLGPPRKRLSRASESWLRFGWRKGSHCLRPPREMKVFRCDMRGATSGKPRPSRTWSIGETTGASLGYGSIVPVFGSSALAQLAYRVGRDSVWIGGKMDHGSSAGREGRWESIPYFLAGLQRWKVWKQHTVGVVSGR